MKIKIDSIIIENRFRKDLGDLSPLAESMKEVGQLNPVIVNSEWKLIAGQRRLEAAKLLGWTELEAIHVDSFDDAALAIKAERDENTCRKDFEPSELVALGRELERIESEEAKKRQESGVNQYTEPSGNFPEGSTGRARDKVASALGVSGRTYEKAKKVVEAAEQEPEKFGHLVETMDTESVNAAYKELQGAKKPASEKKQISFLVNPWRVFCLAWDQADDELRSRFLKQWKPSEIFQSAN